jgi:hypothetical protein
MKLELRECAWCRKQFIPIRFDQRFDCRTCLDRYFSREKQQAVAAYRSQQRMASFFCSTPQPADDETDESNPVRRRA